MEPRFLVEQKSMEDRKKALIADVLKQREAAIKAFDEKLARLGYEANSSGKPKRSHHKAKQATATEQAKAKAKS